jgi:opine dehydrogenase
MSARQAMRIAILGGGHGCFAAAADLSELGHDVRWWRRNALGFEAVRAAGGLALKDSQGERMVPIAMMSADIGEVVREAELILMPVPATSHDDIARALAPHLRAGQVVFLTPGTFGSWVTDAIVRASGNRAMVTYAETGTLPYLARTHGPSSVAITIRAVRLPTGVYPLENEAHALQVIRRAYPSVHACGDALSGALMNAGPVIHPPLILLNAAPLQHFERWDIHNEGTTAAVRAVTTQLDAERMSVREALGYAAPHYPLTDHYDSDRWMYGDAHRRLTDSGDWRESIDLLTHRYMTEDVVLGLAFLASVARMARLPVPVCTGLLAIAGAILGRPFLGQVIDPGIRSLEALALSNLTWPVLQRLLRQGVAQ